MLPKLGLRKNNPNIDIGIGIENLELDNIAYRISAKKPISNIPTLDVYLQHCLHGL